MNNKYAIAPLLNYWSYSTKTINALRQQSIYANRRWWVKPELEVRDTYGAYATVFTYFKLCDHEAFKKFLRMSVPEFAYLFSLVEPALKKRAGEHLYFQN